jgi:hypothetical protein
MTLSRSGFLALSLLCAAFVCLLFLPGLPGGFVFDDVGNIVENSGIQLQSLRPEALLEAATSAQPGGHTRVLPTLTFALDYFRGNGFDPATFKITNIAIHALTTFVLAWFLRNLLLIAGVVPPRAQWAALAMAVAWAAHPLQVSSVLYVVQRMQTMATLFLLLALLSYVNARKAQMAGNSGRTSWMLAGLLWVLAIACKEDAILLPAYTLALELTVLRYRAADPTLTRKLQRGYLVMGLLGIASFLLIIVPHYWSWDAYPGRNFSSYERLLTQARVLCMYLGQILLPLPSHMPFYYDWLQPSRGLLQPWTTLPALLLLLALLALAWRLRVRRPLFALGIFLFFAGHFVTSNVIALELAFEHRNHFPLIGIVLAVGDLLVLAANRFNASIATRATTCVVVLLALAGTTAVRAASWNSGLAVAKTSTQVAPMSARAWNSLCITWFELGGGAKPYNPNLDKAIAACSKGAEVSDESIYGLTNVIAFKTIQGTITSADWDRYLQQLQRVPMTAVNAAAIWVILNKARDGMPVDGDRMFEAIDITNRRRPFGAIESAAIGYFIIGHTQQPERAYPYFASAVQTAKDPSFAKGIVEELNKEGRKDMASKLEAIAEQRDKATD